MDKPLISSGVVCYNQEIYIRGAVESAFLQTSSVEFTFDCKIR
jgi:hypothetical protein